MLALSYTCSGCVICMWWEQTYYYGLAKVVFHYIVSMVMLSRFQIPLDILGVPTSRTTLRPSGCTTMVNFSYRLFCSRTDGEKLSFTARREWERLAQLTRPDAIKADVSILKSQQQENVRPFLYAHSRFSHSKLSPLLIAHAQQQVCITFAQ